MIITIAMIMIDVIIVGSTAAAGMTLHLNQRSRLEPRPIRFVAASRSVRF